MTAARPESMGAGSGSATGEERTNAAMARSVIQKQKTARGAYMTMTMTGE